MRLLVRSEGWRRCCGDFARHNVCRARRRAFEARWRSGGPGSGSRSVVVDASRFEFDSGATSTSRSFRGRRDTTASWYEAPAGTVQYAWRSARSNSFPPSDRGSRRTPAPHNDEYGLLLVLALCKRPASHGWASCGAPREIRRREALNRRTWSDNDNGDASTTGGAVAMTHTAAIRVWTPMWQCP
jgi:hypothetical protein